MSKIKDYSEEHPLDKFGAQSPEHVAYHQSFHSDCSDCRKERRMLEAWKTVNIPPIEMPPRNWAKSVINKIIYGEDHRFYDKN